MHASYFQFLLVLVTASLELQFVNSLDLFSENLDDPSSEIDWMPLKSDPEDDNVDLFEDYSDVSLTDTILTSGCDAQQQSLIDDGLSLFSRDTAACQSTSQPSNQPPLPLSSETFQLFQDPASLEGLLRNNLPIKPKYPGLLSPGEQLEREWSYQDYHDTSDMDGESWKAFEGDSGPCDRFNRLGLEFPVCCDGPANMIDGYRPENWLQYHRVWECDPLGRMY